MRIILRIFGYLSIGFGIYVMQFDPITPVILVTGGLILATIPSKAND